MCIRDSLSGVLHGEMLADGGLTKVRGGAARHDRALAHDGIGAGEAPGELEVLLDQEHRDAALLDAQDRILDLEDHVGLNPLGGLVHEAVSYTHLTLPTSDL